MYSTRYLFEKWTATAAVCSRRVDARRMAGGTRCTASARNDVSFSTLHAIQLLNPINHEFVQSLFVGGLYLNKNIRYTPAGVSVAHSLQLAHRRNDIASLSWSYADQNIGSHGRVLLP